MMASDQEEPPRPFLYHLLSKDDYELLQYHYMKIQFKDSLDKSKRCYLCERIPIDHFVSDRCDHIYCNYCCDVISKQLNNHCPMCYQNCGYMSGRVVEVTLKVLALDVYCPNQQNGCTFFSTYLEMADHIHKCLKTDKVHNPIEFVNELEEEVVLKYPTKFSWNLGNTIELIKHVKLTQKFKLASPITRCLTHPFKVNVIYNTSSGRLCLKVHLDEAGQYLERPFPRVKYVIRDGAQKSDVVYYREAQCLFTDRLETDQEYYETQLSFFHLYDFETIVVDVELKVDMSSKWYDGVFNWELYDFSDRVRSEMRQVVLSQYSPIFYTNRREYAIMAEMRLYKELVLWVKIISGPYDGALARTRQRFLVVIDFQQHGLPESSEAKSMAFSKLSNGPIVSFPLDFLGYYLPDEEYKFTVSIAVTPVLPSKLPLRSIPKDSYKICIL